MRTRESDTCPIWIVGPPSNRQRTTLGWHDYHFSECLGVALTPRKRPTERKSLPCPKIGPGSLLTPTEHLLAWWSPSSSDSYSGAASCYQAGLGPRTGSRGGLRECLGAGAWAYYFSYELMNLGLFLFFSMLLFPDPRRDLYFPVCGGQMYFIKFSTECGSHTNILRYFIPDPRYDSLLNSGVNM